MKCSICAGGEIGDCARMQEEVVGGLLYFLPQSEHSHLQKHLCFITILNLSQLINLCVLMHWLWMCGHQQVMMVGLCPSNDYTTGFN